MIRAISPREVEVAIANGANLPDCVIEAVNQLLIKKGAHDCITLMQPEVVTAIMERMGVTDKRIVYVNNWLDFEPFYRKAGWQVTYDRPGYCETYEANWKFEKS